MTMLEITEFGNMLADYILLLSLPSLLLFIYYYGRNRTKQGRFVWRERFVGRTIMYLVVSLTLVLIVNALSLFLGTEYAFRPLVRLASYGTLAFVSYRLFRTLRAVQKLPPVDHSKPDDFDRTIPTKERKLK